MKPDKLLTTVAAASPGSGSTPRFNISFGKRLLLLLCLTLVCWVLTSFINMFFISSAGGVTPRIMRILSVVQDVLLFIVPAVVTAVMSTRRPAWLLGVMDKPRMGACLLAIAVLLVSIPALNAVVEWNQNISLPQWMAGIEQWMRSTEDNASQLVNKVLTPQGPLALVVSVLIVGVLAGFSEELFFRGALQRLLTTGNVNRHVAVWCVAIIFSAIHMQFYGFVPRMLLGAYFGYLLVWSGSLWLPVLAHIVNNTLYVVANAMISPDAAVRAVQGNGGGASTLPAVLCSAALTALGLYLLWRRRVPQPASVK